MSLAKNVLLITNTTTEDEIKQIQSAIAMQKELHIHLQLVHVIPSLPTCYFNIPSTVLLAERYYDEAQKSLTSIGNTLGVERKHQWLVTGKIKTEVLRLASKLQSNFILASSTEIEELHKAGMHKRERNHTLIQSIHNLVRL